MLPGNLTTAHVRKNSYKLFIFNNKCSDKYCEGHNQVCDVSTHEIEKLKDMKEFSRYRINEGEYSDKDLYPREIESSYALYDCCRLLKFFLFYKVKNIIDFIM